MKFQVVLQRLALQDLQGYYEHAAKHSVVDATNWLTRFQTALAGLDERPERCSLAAENDCVDVEVREFLFGKRPNVYRAILIIDGPTVRILRIRRSQRRVLTAEELRRAIADEEWNQNQNCSNSICRRHQSLNPSTGRNQASDSNSYH